MSEIHYDPYDFEIDDDPHPVWRRMRDRCFGRPAQRPPSSRKTREASETSPGPLFERRPPPVSVKHVVEPGIHSHHDLPDDANRLCAIGVDRRDA